MINNDAKLWNEERLIYYIKIETKIKQGHGA